VKKKLQKNINPEAQKKRRKDAFQSAVISTFFIFANAILLIWLRSHYLVEGFWGAVLLILAILELIMIIPIWILLKTRLKEIEGGEEDVATQY